MRAYTIKPDDGCLYGLCALMTFSAANKYHAYARECLKLAETATTPDIREKLIELSRVWIEAALNEERHHIAGFSEPPNASQPGAPDNFTAR
jgi:hypothetical protein